MISVTYMCDLKVICMISTRRQQHLVLHTNTLGNLWKSSKHLWDVLVMLRTVGTSSKVNWKPGGGGGLLPYITYTGMCHPSGSWFWSSWFRTGYPFQRRFLERGKKIVDHGFIFGLFVFCLFYLVADYEEAFLWCISRKNKEISF